MCKQLTLNHNLVSGLDAQCFRVAVVNDQSVESFEHTMALSGEGLNARRLTLDDLPVSSGFLIDTEVARLCNRARRLNTNCQTFGSVDVEIAVL